ncbi:MAG: hypothetical protein LBR07_05460 [Puniceicoccales bacterium]|jgi:Trk-type K+ transport system membrane component|nr:hypothetical protein [Puniceicoccales bacterium]
MASPLSENVRATLLYLANVLLWLCGLAALGMAVWLFGWPVSEHWHEPLAQAARLVLLLFALQAALRAGASREPSRYLWRHKLETFFALVAVAELLAGVFYGGAHGIAGAFASGVKSRGLVLGVISLTLLTVLVPSLLRGLRKSTFLSSRNLSPGLVMLGSFALLALAGTLALLTPNATPAGAPKLSLPDAIFTATSAASVTGLTVIETGRDLSLVGQCVVLGLAQLGGLGVMTLTYFFAYFITGGVTLRNRFALQELLSEDNLGQVGAVLLTIVGFTLCCEVAGAVLLCAALDGATLPAEAHGTVFFAVFHSVMAFCNAGFSTLGGSTGLGALTVRPAALLIIGTLVLAGGVGFPVVKNCWQALLGRAGRALGLRAGNGPRLNTNTRLVLWTTLALSVGGALALLAIDALPSGAGNFSGTGAGGGTTGGSATPRWAGAVFDAFAGRTAGFTFNNAAGTSAAAALVLMPLMFVGGGPSGTAGGIKTTTFAVAALALRRVLLGRRDIEAFGRRLEEGVAHRALAALFAALGFILLVTLVLCVLEPARDPFDLAFAAVSAVSTCGLTRGTPPAQFGAPAKLVLAAAMLVGRAGVLTALLALVPRPAPPSFRLPETSVVIN